MSTDQTPGQQSSPAIEKLLSEAVAHHRAGRNEDAEALYNAILQTAPHHPEANHNLGVLALHTRGPDAGLDHLLAALEADPAQRQYWLSYIDALIRAGQLDAARQVLDIARQQGLPDDDVAAMLVFLNDAGRSAKPAPAGSLTGQPDRKSREDNPRKGGGAPAAGEIDALAALFRNGPSEEVISQARSMTERFPAHAFGWQVLGIVLSQLRRYEEALPPLLKTAELSSGDAKAHYNLGFVYQELGRYAEAEARYRNALKIKPDNIQAHCNLAHIYLQLDRTAEAEASSRLALKINPDHAESLNNLGSILIELGRLDEAEASIRRALQLNPDYAVAHGNLGLVLQKLYRNEEALACFQQQLRLDPGNAIAEYQIAQLAGDSNPERAPDQYVKNVFDSYAHRFDTHLQQELHYETPNKLAALLGQFLPTNEKRDVLDLGCGTGLMGVAIAPLARTLVGVDLSPKMLEKARVRDLYQRLECSELLGMMQQEPSSSYDLIIAADVFVYVGKLEEIVREARRLLRPGGYFTFSIESLNDPGGTAGDYQLKQTGRYSHSVKYLLRLAADAGFQVLASEATPIRNERGKPVGGHINLWKSG